MSVDQILTKAKSHAKRGDHDTAQQLLEDLLKKFPTNKRAQQALVELADISPDGGKKPPIPDDQFAALVTLYNQGALAQLVQQGEALLERYRTSAAVYNVLGLAYAGLGQSSEAIACYERALKIDNTFLVAHYNLGNALNHLGRKEEAAACYERTLKLNPRESAAHNNLGVALQALGQMDAAVAHYKRALEIKPDFTDAHINFGNILNTLGHKEEAIACYAQALHLSPNDARAHNNMGIAFQDLGQKDKAIASYRSALKINPGYIDAHTQYLSQLAETCDWPAMAAEAAAIPALGTGGDPTAPFGMLILEDHPARHRLRSEACARQHFHRVALPPPARPSAVPERLRIGYFSGDFGDHAVMQQMARLFELHDRKAFSIHAYAYGPRRENAMYQRLSGAFDGFHEVEQLSDRDIAMRARQDGIDIAVDLNGYTKDTRLGILGYRAAPVQMSYLGFPGTTGAPFIDYLVADRVIIPPEQRQHYSEKIVYLPGSYQVNDDTRTIANRVWTRADMKLPAHGFVFCCFNNTYKLSPREFDIWMRLLNAVEGSVLWLSKANTWAAENLKREAENRGVSASRIVFAEKLPSTADHLARIQLADLFLDTFTFNAHATASDALWAGVPVVTKPSEGFAARVAASVLTAIGLPELITDSPEAYEQMAVDLAMNPGKLTALKAKLLQNRNTMPLFDSELFTRNIEKAYRQAYEGYVAGRAPDDIVVPA